MNELSQEQEQLLEAVLCGALRDDDPRVAAALSDTAFARRLRSLRSTQSVLDRAFAAERELQAPGSVAKVPAVEPRGQRPRRGTLRLVAAAAALVLLGSVAYWVWPQPVPQERWLGGTIAVTASAPGYEQFTFGFVLPAGGRFVIRVTHADRVLLDAVEHPDTTWRPDPAVVRGWPDAIRVDVRAIDAAGSELGRGRVDLRR